MKTMTVYCGSWFGNNPKYKQIAKTLGQEMAKNNITLVYGGGMFGMMGVLAKEIRDNGGDVIGITTPKIWDREHSPEFANENTGEPLPLDDVEPIFTDDISIRKNMLKDKGDVLCALPGSIGTLDEFYEVLVQQHVGMIKKPIIVLNTDGYYDHVMEQIKVAIREGFTTEKVLDAFKMVSSPEEIIPVAKQMLASMA